MTAESIPVQIDDYQLTATRWPADGRHPVVLLHAGVCDQRSWERTMSELTGLGPLIAYDRRGFGTSPVSATPYREVDDLWAVVDATTDQPEPVWLVGSSMGGLVAIDAALTSPARVAGLILFAPAVSGEPDPVKLDAESEALFEQLQAAGKAGDQAERARVHAALWLDGPTSAEGRVSGPARDLALAMNEIILRNDVPDDAGSTGIEAWPQLEQIRVPVTVACGELDLPFLLEQCEQIAARIPQARHVVLPAVAHLPYLEQPELVADVIRETLRTS
jgi:pimeloyl-ACP methyl ester carboxylesterase